METKKTWKRQLDTDKSYWEDMEGTAKGNKRLEGLA